MTSCLFLWTMKVFQNRERLSFHIRVISLEVYPQEYGIQETKPIINQIYREHHIKVISSLSGETGNSVGKVSQSDMFLAEPDKLDIKKNINIVFCLSCIKECQTNEKQI